MTAPTVAVRRTVVPRLGVLADVGFVVAGALLVAACAQIEIKLPFAPVPITGQTFAVVLAGAALGAARGAASMSLYWVLGLGLPFYSGGESGWEVATGATGGYLVGFVLAGALVGHLAERGWDRRFGSSVGAMMTGNVVIYGLGNLWLARELGTGLERTLELGLYPFIVGDVLKLYLAAGALPLAWRLIGRHRDDAER